MVCRTCGVIEAHFLQEHELADVFWHGDEFIVPEVQFLRENGLADAFWAG